MPFLDTQAEKEVDGLYNKWRATLDAVLPPSTLYHYTRTGGALGIVTNGYLRATNMAYMNDSQEHLYAIDGFEKTIRALLQQQPNMQPEGAAMLEEAIRRCQLVYTNRVEPLFLVSFTPKRNDLSQWQAYGGGESGYALGFDPVRLKGLAQRAGGDLVINPDTVTLTPGTIIPVAQNSRGLQPLQPPGKFDVSQLILENLRGNIKRALYDEMLGPPTGTPMSATEVSERTADLYRRIGSAYGRLQQELVQPVVRRVLYVLRKRGLVKMPSLGHGAVEVHSVSPLASAQAQEDVLKFQQFAAMIAGTFGPQMMTMLIKPGPTTEWLARQQGVRSDLLYSEAEQQQLLAQMQSMAAGMSGAPNAA